jgi:predicted ATPase
MMRLSSLSVENYRAFVAADRVALRPLTIVFGYNSSGKSALLRLLPYVADVLGDGVERNVERLGKLRHARLALGEALQDGPAGGIREGDQGVVEVHVSIINPFG